MNSDYSPKIVQRVHVGAWTFDRFDDDGRILATHNPYGPVRVQFHFSAEEFRAFVEAADSIIPRATTGGV